MSNQDHAYALPLGFMLEEYQIERVLGSGGFGITYYAWDRHLDKAVAIKEYLPNEFAVRYEDTTVAPKSSSDAETYEWGLTRFLEEARILAGFDHPNINRVYRRLEAHGTAYMVLEYLPGESLSARLKRTGRLSPEEVWRLFNEILSGLSEVHRQDYVHRDIKPGNIMFREDGGAVLLDFGAARQAVGQRSKSITSILTPGYAPIEQYDQKAVYVGPWTDFYALGVVAYRCVTGVGEGELLDAVARNLLVSRGEAGQDMRPAVALAKGGYDQRLLKAIDWCMQVDQRERPQGVADLEEMLAGGASKEKKKLKPAPKPKPESKPRHPAIWAAVGAVVALLLGFGVWQWFSPSPPAPPPLADDPGEVSAPAVVPASPPAPPPRVAAEPGSLMLELSPADAQVILPDIESPYRPGMALAAGSYRVVVRQAGYEEFAGTLRIEADRRTTRKIALAEKPGSLMLELEPRDAQVMLPDIESPYRPGLALPAGEYRVVVRREGYEAFDDTLRIEAGRRMVRAIVLAEKPGSLVLELEPADAQVSLPDIESPYRPGLELPAGEYRVVVRRAGYEAFDDTLRIEAGQRTTRAIALTEELGSLMLELEPRDAQVMLPDIESSYRPGLELPAGEYRVMVRRAGYEVFEDTLRIAAGRRTTRTIVLAEKPGSLMLELEPADAEVSLPDIESPYRPGLALPAGEYRVVVRRAGYEAFEEAVHIEAARLTTRAIVLRRAVLKRAVGEVFRDALRSGGEGPEMVVLPTGRFWMGDSDGGGEANEKPVRAVTITRPIAIGKYEVTFSEYEQFAAVTGAERPDAEGWGRGNRPVINVSQKDARAYAAWLSEQTGKRYRLPSEAEWEYAARAVTSTAERSTIYSWGDEIGRNRANCAGCGSEWDDEKTAPVGSFAANAFGLHDMHGNVWEWVEDCWHDNYEGAPTDGSAWMEDDCGSVVARGGSGDSDPQQSRSAVREGAAPSVRGNVLGFRLAQDIAPPTSDSLEEAKKPGSLMLELEPRNAQVILPGIKSPYRPGLELPAGEYRVVVRRAGYEAFEDILSIEAGRRTTRAIALRRAVSKRAVGEEFRDALQSGGKGPAMVLLPTGRFRMGDLNGDGNNDEKHVRTVTISRPIAMGKYEVTVGEFRRFVTATAYQTEAERNTGVHEGCYTMEIMGRNEWDSTPGRSWSNLGIQCGRKSAGDLCKLERRAPLYRLVKRRDWRPLSPAERSGMGVRGACRRR